MVTRQIPNLEIAGSSPVGGVLCFFCPSLGLEHFLFALCAFSFFHIDRFLHLIPIQSIPTPFIMLPYITIGLPR
ncbi:hypothetical protein QBC46DRAFT_47788 [Diplogelasinospora grovesii]|uniref:Uncharacterized protein n=1 Tax=Diplogelasinospora grovesii TaxID=303347 RepID=A0AAN6NC85_9PEZI|nr:hypothetical protein QBC46DRAFT_47788 [Diplogelasinospora grovesii]